MMALLDELIALLGSAMPFINRLIALNQKRFMSKSVGNDLSVTQALVHTFAVKAVQGQVGNSNSNPNFISI